MGSFSKVYKSLKEDLKRVDLNLKSHLENPEFWQTTPAALKELKLRSKNLKITLKTLRTERGAYL